MYWRLNAKMRHCYGVFAPWLVVAALAWIMLASTPAQAAASKLAIVIDISQQKLFLYRADRVLRSYPVSTSRYGMGNRAKSMKTPLGEHVIAQKIGMGAPLHTVFKGRRATGKIHPPKRGDKNELITSRILVLRGKELGRNLGPGVDTQSRGIYIHGTNVESRIGRPASHGCVRMKNRDVVELANAVAVGARVVLRP